MINPELENKYNAASTFAKENIKALSKEMLEWQDTGIVPARGLIRQLQSLCSFASNPLHLAQVFTSSAAYEHIAASNNN